MVRNSLNPWDNIKSEMVNIKMGMNEHKRIAKKFTLCQKLVFIGWTWSLILYYNTLARNTKDYKLYKLCKILNEN